MDRGFFVNHLIEQDCYPDEYCDSEISQLWINAINGEVCYLPYENELALATYCHIIWELKIDPPLQYDDDYHVYSSFRTHLKNNS